MIISGSGGKEMEREIIFRGKRIDNGEWIEGDGIHYPKSVNYKGICFIDGMKYRANDWLEVAPETVGQYTGLKDNNANRIFEGDIIDVTYFSYQQPESSAIFKVIYEGMSFLLEFINGNCFEEPYAEEWDIIGNIHDNPELLEVQ
jgi:uncharacterized phage protein (TIGR01671 family)